MYAGKGRNVENQNVESLKVDQKFEKDQNVESLFLNWSECQKWRAWSERQKSERQKEHPNSKVKNDFWHSDFTYGVKKDQNVKNWKEKLPRRITYVYQGLLGVRLGSITLG